MGWCRLRSAQPTLAPAVCGEKKKKKKERGKRGPATPSPPAVAATAVACSCKKGAQPGVPVEEDETVGTVVPTSRKRSGRKKMKKKIEVDDVDRWLWSWQPSPSTGGREPYLGSDGGEEEAVGTLCPWEERGSRGTRAASSAKGKKLTRRRGKEGWRHHHRRLWLRQSSPTVVLVAIAANCREGNPFGFP